MTEHGIWKQSALICVQMGTQFNLHRNDLQSKSKIPGPDPWPRPGMQGLSSMDYTPEVLQLLYSAPAKSRQGRLALKEQVI